MTQDEFVALPELDHFRIRGYGGSDMSPALQRLAEDTEVEAALVLTDGYIDYPPQSPPYELLWILPVACADSFQPPYGNILTINA